MLLVYCTLSGRNAHGGKRVRSDATCRWWRYVHTRTSCYTLPYRHSLVACTGSPYGSLLLPTPVSTRFTTHPSSSSAPRPWGVTTVRGPRPLFFLRATLYVRQGRQGSIAKLARSSPVRSPSRSCLRVCSPLPTPPSAAGFPVRTFSPHQAPSDSVRIFTRNARTRPVLPVKSLSEFPTARGTETEEILAVTDQLLTLSTLSSLPTSYHPSPVSSPAGAPMAPAQRGDGCAYPY